VPVTDIEGARVALQGGRPAELLGLAECSWLDAKAGVYRLDDPAKAEELVKDVAGFANARGGGLLLVGFTTRRDHDAEILDGIRPAPRGLVDLDQHRKLIRERVIPSPRGVNVEFINCGADNGILVIDVPAQPEDRLPFVVPGPTRTAQVSRLSVAVPVREADATIWLPQAELQRLLAAGWRASGPREELLALMRDLRRQELERRHEVAAPVLEGHVIRSGIRVNDVETVRLEIRVMSPVTLSVLTVVLLVGSPVNQRPGPMMMEHWIEYPPPARSTVIEPGRPAHWDVYLVDEPKPFTVVVTARNEYGEKWDRLVVRVVFDF
jgi:hypothetical protein